jgi:hypothetical protein
MGAAMKPQLVTDDRPGGPQTLSARAGARAAGATDGGLSYAAYSGQVPAYVTGTDAQRPAEATFAPPPDTTAESYYVSPIRDEPLPRGEVRDARAAVYGVRAEHITYPSLDGGAAYDDVSRAEKTSVLQTADLEDEAPTEAAGDTRAAR